MFSNKPDDTLWQLLYFSITWRYAVTFEKDTLLQPDDTLRQLKRILYYSLTICCDIWNGYFTTAWRYAQTIETDTLLQPDDKLWQFERIL